jgi:steroid delta-isomerase-like uncharacterized protein
MSNNQTLTRRYFEDIWNRKDVAAVDELVAAEVVGHVGAVTLRGRDTLKQRVTMMYGIYTQPQFTIEEQIAEGDKVLVRWRFRGTHSGEFMGVAPTGKTINVTGMSLFRIAAGRIAELWLNADDLGELQQLGVLPAPQAA